jgi:hypothetical protein
MMLEFFYCDHFADWFRNRSQKLNEKKSRFQKPNLNFVFDRLNRTSFQKSKRKKS